jgi:hypothetical protein
VKISCPRDYTHRPGADSRWTATGRFNVNRHGHRRAELRCLSPGCNTFWSSTRQEALAAGEAIAADPEMAPGTNELPASVRVPQPTLPMQMTRGGDFVSAQQLARATQFERFLDSKRRTAGGD